MFLVQRQHLEGVLDLLWNGGLQDDRRRGEQRRSTLLKESSPHRRGSQDVHTCHLKMIALLLKGKEEEMFALFPKGKKEMLAMAFPSESLHYRF